MVPPSFHRPAAWVAVILPAGQRPVEPSTIPGPGGVISWPANCEVLQSDYYPSMSSPRKPSSVPTLIPFIVMAVVLVIIYLGMLVFPMVKQLINQQDCVASGRDDCYPHS